MSGQTTQTVQPNATPNRQAMLGGAIIDGQGREIPITESMIQRACRELERLCAQAPKQG